MELEQSQRGEAGFAELVDGPMYNRLPFGRDRSFSVSEWRSVPAA